MRSFYLFMCVGILISCNSGEEEAEAGKKVPQKLENILKVEIRGIPKGFSLRDYTLSGDGRIAFTTMQLPNAQRSFILQIDNEKGVPLLASFSGEYNDLEPMFAPGDSILLFTSDRPLYAGDTVRDYNIWFCRIKKGKAGDPEPFDTIINTSHDEYYPSMNKKGDLYFTAAYPERHRDDIYVSKKNDSTYEKPAILNICKDPDLYEFNAWIHPDDSLIIFSIYGRTGEKGGGDLYYSHKGKEGDWQEPVLTTEEINTMGLDFSPFLKGDTLYFTSRRQDTSWNTQTFNYLAEITKHADSNVIGEEGIYYTLFSPED